MYYLIDENNVFPDVMVFDTKDEVREQLEYLSIADDFEDAQWTLIEGERINLTAIKKTVISID